MNIEHLILFLFVPLISWLERQRGMSKDIEIIPKYVALTAIGYLCAVFTGHYLDWQAAVITVTVYAAHSIGYGQPWGWALTGKPHPDFEKWQAIGALNRNPWLPLGVRGLMVGAATLFALDPIASLKIAIAFGVAFPLSAYIVRYVLKMPVHTEAKSGKAWARGEYIRGALFGVILFGGSFL